LGTKNGRGGGVGKQKKPELPSLPSPNSFIDMRYIDIISK
jgi:hypothetical protein